MNIRKAIEETMELANKLEGSSRIESLSQRHLQEMYTTIQCDDTMSDTKLCRWLGWMQAAITSWGVVGLVEMKEINKRNA